MKRILFVMLLMACILLAQGGALAGLTTGIAAVSLDDSEQPSGDGGGTTDGGSTDSGGAE